MAGSVRSLRQGAGLGASEACGRRRTVDDLAQVLGLGTALARQLAVAPASPRSPGCRRSCRAPAPGTGRRKAGSGSARRIAGIEGIDGEAAFPRWPPPEREITARRHRERRRRGTRRGDLPTVDEQRLFAAVQPLTPILAVLKKGTHFPPPRAIRRLRGLRPGAEQGGS